MVSKFVPKLQFLNGASNKFFKNKKITKRGTWQRERPF